MLRTSVGVCFCLLLICCAVLVSAQQPVITGNSSNAVVPSLVSFSGVLTDVNGKLLTGVVGVTFALYKDSQGGAPLWLETQNVYPDKTGHYKVLLGATSSSGLPADLFVAGEARWLGVQPQGQAEQPRVSLLSVPYALKAADAQTLGGLPPSAFVLAAPPSSAATSVAAPSATAQPMATGTTPVTTAGGTINKLAKFDATADITNSVIFDNGTNVGIGNTSPATKLDVSGGANIRGLLTMPTKGTATATAGFNSQPIKLAASAFNSGTGTAAAQNFQLQAEPAGNNTATTSGTLNLLYATGSNALAETGLKIASNGRITFAAGQTFPGVGSGTVKSVASGAGLTGGPITTSGTLSIATGGVTNAMLTNPSLTITPGTALVGGGTVALGGTATLGLNTAVTNGLYARLATANSFTGTQAVNGNVAATGLVSAAGFQIGSYLFGWGSYTNANAFLGYGGNPATTGGENTAIGAGALVTNTSGSWNTATGQVALWANTIGYRNTALGVAALRLNTTGNDNNATGTAVLFNNLTGAGNTASGNYALYSNTSGGQNTAVGLSSLYFNTASDNAAIGAGAMYHNTTGSQNTANGKEALWGNTSGYYNTATGYHALYAGTGTSTASYNTANGYNAMPKVTTGSSNTAVGSNTLLANLSGYDNTAVGVNAGLSTTGSYNTNIGYYAGYYDTTGSDNIRINNYGVAGETNTARIGSYINRTFIAGIRGVTTGVANAIPVVIDSSGQLGTVSSSRRVKQDIRDMGETTTMLMSLRPVRFRYKAHGANGPEQYGLVAEEVAEVAPELVATNPDGQIETVYYDKINAMLLNQVQTQQRLIESLETRLAELEGRVSKK